MANSKKKCRGCKKFFANDHAGSLFSGVSFWHSKTCQVDYTIANRKPLIKQGKEIRAKEKRKDTREKKAAMRPLQWHKEDAQKWFNKFTRLSNPYDDCASCDRDLTEIFKNDGWKRGGAFDCGHFHSRGARSDLRFTEDNAWSQCKSCNGGAGKFAKKDYTVAKRYREKLIDRIGLERVEALDFDPGPHTWTIDELKEISATYKAKCKQLEN